MARGYPSPRLSLPSESRAAGSMAVDEEIGVWGQKPLKPASASCDLGELPKLSLELSLHPRQILS